jgi:hypothetical protein
MVALARSGHSLGGVGDRSRLGYQSLATEAGVFVSTLRSKDVRYAGAGWKDGIRIDPISVVTLEAAKCPVVRETKLHDAPPGPGSRSETAMRLLRSLR